jgi:hypothetical protein
VGVTENDTNLRGSGALLRELADLVNDLLGGGLEPCRGSARVGDGRGRYALSVGVESSHGGGLLNDVQSRSRVVVQVFELPECAETLALACGARTTCG